MPPKDSDTVVGRHAHKRNHRVFIEQKHRQEHLLASGVSGSGKTYFLEQMIRQDIEAGWGCAS